MNDQIKRKCKKCGEEYPLTRDYFYVDSGRICGFRDPCKKCINKTLPHNPKIIDLNNKKCPSCDIIFPRTDEYFYKSNHNTWDNLLGVCKKCHNKKVKERNQRNPEISRKANIKYKKNHSEKVKEGFNKRRKERYASDSNFRMSVLLRNGLRLALNGKKKLKRTMNLLGCSIDYFNSYIESQFTDGMSWENQGYWGWQLDHIIPIAYFDLNKSEDQEKCFHYTNFRPLWYRDNFNKNSIYNGFLYRSGRIIKEKKHDESRKIQSVA